MPTSEPSLKIAFIHPDLGIGGAERLVVDAALAAQQKGHQVIMYTSHHDPSHCFEETRDGTLKVKVIGDKLPRHVFHRFFILCSILRQFQLTMWIALYHRDTYDALFIDQLSACVPLLKWATSARILFYCHFPDKLLAIRTSRLKEAYRYVFDKLEEWTTNSADAIVVNSKFTRNTFKQSFPSIDYLPKVLYPPINFAAYDRAVDYSDPLVQILESPKNTLVSINRFERKKNIALALLAFAELKRVNMIPADVFAQYRLVIAGGYDRRVRENVEYLEELEALATNQLQLKVAKIFPGTTQQPDADAQVVFVCSFNDNQRTFLLQESKVLLYTPTNEHFGITPVEGMYSSIPVIATNTGGPLESINDKVTGLLLPPDVQLWADGLRGFISGEFDGVAMGRNGRAHVQKKFSIEAFGDHLNTFLHDMMTASPRPVPGFESRWGVGCWLTTLSLMILLMTVALFFL
ncbi:alpha-1,3/1,6-mannosyltransferase ALG2 [Hesseltinella vesiculosa]|uniref:Alpha-1,3/1,6-mannosyltransferase ALG2 n=1 Tax=Hesseltinella vesiculosa TaxID=101127 RepID=A0A1X2GTB4_9FUNG|nr:alpha-1,3/1,6-mannosyltransferase ALG2 [Hesseltinella vesiculosa]